MISIRRNVFETNSSSTHSICISKQHTTWGDNVAFRKGEFGWENDTVYDTASYLYTGILEQENSEELLDKLKSILDDHEVKYSFQKAEKFYGYVDHGYELCDFINTLLDDEDMLCRFLFGDSVIYTGNDNSCDDEPRLCEAAFESLYDWDNRRDIPNPYHDENKYDYFYKGN